MVNVLVQAPAGTPVSGIAVALCDSQATAIARTNVEGGVRLTGVYPASATRVWCQLSRYSEPVVTPAAIAEQKKYDETVTAYAFERFYRIDLDERTEYSVSIVGQPAVRVSGTVLPFATAMEDRNAFRLMGRKPGENLDTGVDIGDGTFSLGGIAKGQPIDLIIGWTNRSEVLIRPFDAIQTQSDLSLGVIQTPPRVAGGRKLAITMERIDAVSGSLADPSDRGSFITVVRDDAQKVYWFGLPRGNIATARTGEWHDAIPRLPPGNYFLAPGFPELGKHGNRLYKLLLAGRSTDLVAAGVPRLVVPNDGAKTPIVFSFDAVAAETAMDWVKR